MTYPMCNTSHSGSWQPLPPEPFRACMAVISVGYEEQAVGYTRLVAELVTAPHNLVDDHSGEHASQWLKGTPKPDPSLLTRSSTSEYRDQFTLV